MKNIQSVLFIIVSTSMLFFGCSDNNSTGIPDEDPPEIPEMAPAEVDISYFNDADAGSGEEYQLFNTSRSYALTGSTTLNTGLGFGGFYFGLTEQSEADFEDGWWTWTYTYQEGDESFTIKTTAREQGNRIEWAVYISGTFDEGQSLDEFLFIEGYTEDNASSGEWNLYFPDNEGSWNYSWAITSETEYELNYTLTSNDGEEFVVNYTIDGAENNLEFSGYELESTAYLYWNTDTGTGWLEQDGDRQCWNENFQQTSCS